MNPEILKSERTPVIVVVVFTVTLITLLMFGVRHSWREQDEVRRYCNTHYAEFSTEWENCIQYR